MRDHDELEVGLLLPRLDDVVDGRCEGFDVSRVEVGGRLVEGEDAAVEAEALRQRQPDDERGKDLLPGGAAATHVKARVALGHDDAVALLARACRGLALVLAVDLNAVDVGPLVGLVPELLDALIDALHLATVELHQGAVERLVVVVEVLNSEVRRLALDQLLPMLVVHLAVLILLQVLLGALDAVGHRFQGAVGLRDLDLECGDARIDLADLTLDVLRVGQRRHLLAFGLDGGI
mmetsp:Transcript_17905/g.42479  ORF Transcript_17905/g.42479 Transcript_17905/m.42479 type:complete len:235 (+) Transcript_17905:411-1115(+)